MIVGQSRILSIASSYYYSWSLTRLLVKSFARIHETNLKKQGMLGITFDNESDYDLIEEDDVFNFTDFKNFAPNKKITIEVIHSDGKIDIIKT